MDGAVTDEGLAGVETERLIGALCKRHQYMAVFLLDEGQRPKVHTCGDNRNLTLVSSIALSNYQAQVQIAMDEYFTVLEEEEED